MFDKPKKNPIEILLEDLKEIPVETYHKDIGSVLRTYKAELDKARRDPMANLKATLIYVDFINKCKEADIPKALLFLGEEDLNVSLLVNVEHAIRERVAGDVPSLRHLIEFALEKNLGKAFNGQIDDGISLLAQRMGKNPFDRYTMYNHLTGKPFQANPPALDAADEVKPTF